MYAYLKGFLVDKHPSHIILELGGIGYIINVPLSTFSKLPALNEELKIQVHYHIKEDAHDLYGFLALEEKELFLRLIAISGFGPKGALSVLSSVSVPLFINAIQDMDIDMLTSIPGIGKKTAQRLILELKEKLDFADDYLSAAPDQGSAKKDAIDALISLGYNLPKARKLIEKTLTGLDDEVTTEELIRLALKKGGR